jgi:hypothetical protein
MPETAVPKRCEADKTEWDRIADTQEFEDLMATKKLLVRSNTGLGAEQAGAH